MSNNSHFILTKSTEATQSQSQMTLPTPYIFDPICASRALKREHKLEKCVCCSMWYSSELYPKYLPCWHSMCEKCIIDRISFSSIGCPLCQKDFHYALESNGFIVGPGNYIKVFDDEDELINIGMENKTSIVEIVNDELSKWTGALYQLFKDICEDKLKISNRESIDKVHLCKQFPFRYFNNKQELLRPEKRHKLEAALKKYDMHLLYEEIYLDKYARATHSIIAENKKFKLDFGYDIDSLQELLDMLNNYQSTQKPSPMQCKQCKKSLAIIKPNNDYPISILNKTENIRQCTDSIGSKYREEVGKKTIFKDIATIVYSPMEQIMFNIPVRLKDNDRLFPQGCIIDGFYNKIGDKNMQFDLHKKYKVCFKCFQKIQDRPFGYDDIISLSAHDIQKYKASHFCPSVMVSMCLRHAIKYKIRFPIMNVFAIVDKSVMDAQYEKDKDKICPLLKCLMQCQYSMKYDEQMAPLNNYLPHKH